MAPDALRMLARLPRTPIRGQLRRASTALRNLRKSDSPARSCREDRLGRPGGPLIRLDRARDRIRVVPAP